jgi:sterol desaturase/sphingolipid hydroxylase (fatty acid hydroxylase superfamily)
VDWSSEVAHFVKGLAQFLNLDSTFSLSSLLCALCIAVGFVVFRRVRRNRRIRPWTIIRALFPKRLLCASTHIDLAYMYYNMFAHGFLFGWALVSYQYLTNKVIAGLVAVAGPVAPTVLPAALKHSIIVVALFIGYELGYWIQHWLCHRVPFFWQFHRVHHSAAVLTPFTNFRVHPVDTILFANVLAVTVAVANGLTNYALGDTSHQHTVSGTNIILIVFIHLYVHLQHTELWIPLRGVLGRIFMSPAHHQLHHSDNPVHFNRNYGSCLAIWDWLFGTLYVPKQQREKLHFGVEPDRFPAHTITGELFAPFVRAAAVLKAAIPSLRAGGQAPLPQPADEHEASVHVGRAPSPVE